MAKALYKVQKQISKKRAGKGNALHVNSRDAQRLRAAGAREDKLSKLMTAATRANQSYGILTLVSYLLAILTFRSGQGSLVQICYGDVKRTSVR
jgi:hypothetical protein